jgi:hypothetical protein
MNRTYSLYDKTTGVFTGQRVDIDDEQLSFLRQMIGAYPGIVNPKRYRVERVVVANGDDATATDELVEYTPPRPDDDALRTWAWDEDAWDWIASPTDFAVGAEVRRERDRRMAEVDWVTLRAYRTSSPVPAEWCAYMQALADVPQQPGFPREIVWPAKPAE